MLHSLIGSVDRPVYKLKYIIAAIPSCDKAEHFFLLGQENF
jgi:hypothetical protein